MFDALNFNALSTASDARRRRLRAPDAGTQAAYLYVGTGDNKQAGRAVAGL
jgi:hypothetical protein